jgi:hypothetical protein
MIECFKRLSSSCQRTIRESSSDMPRHDGRVIVKQPVSFDERF